MRFYKYLTYILDYKQINQTTAILVSLGFLCCFTNQQMLKVNTFTALGGNQDKTGTVPHDKLSEVISRFELTIPSQELVKMLESDNKGKITYASLLNFLTSN